MLLEFAWEHVGEMITPVTCEDEIEDMLADPDLDSLDREALEEILDNI